MGASRAMGRSRMCASPQFRFDHRLETMAAECALLLDIGTNLAELVVTQRFRDKLAVGVLTLIGRRCKRDVSRMREKQSIWNKGDGGIIRLNLLAVGYEVRRPR